MAALPGAPRTVAYEFIPDATVAVLIPLEQFCRSVTLQTPIDVQQCAVAFGDASVVATLDGGASGCIGGFPIDVPRPTTATHMSVITQAAGTISVLQRRP